jgi:hypothetical protein
MKSKISKAASELGNLLGAAANVQSIVEFITGGQFVKTLQAVGYAEYTAAIDALLKLPYAKDSRSVVWSAVNHLESAHAMFRRLYKEAGFIREALDGTGLNEPMLKDVLTLSLMSICYRYLGEKELMLRAIDEGFKALRYSDDIGGHDVLNLISPIEWFRFLKDEAGFGNPDEYIEYESWYFEFADLMRKELSF